MGYIEDIERLILKINVGEDTIRANIVYWIPEDGRIISDLSNDKYCIYWSNQTARYYAVPRKILYQGD